MTQYTFFIFAGVIILFIIQIFFAYSRYKKYRPGKTLIVTGKVSADPKEKLKIYSRGSIFVWPVIQDYFYISHDPLTINLQIPRFAGMSKLSELTFKISSEEAEILKAVEHFAKKDTNEILAILDPILKNKMATFTTANSQVKKHASNLELMKLIQMELDLTLNKYGCEAIHLEITSQ